MHDRHVNQSPFVNGEAILRSLCRRVGNVQLRSLTSSDLSVHLDNPHISNSTRRGQYSIVRGFLHYWFSRDAIPAFTLPAPPRSEIIFLPHIYSAGEVRALLQAITKSQRHSRSIRADTFRMFLLMLYATGASIGELLALRVGDLSSRCTHVVFLKQGGRRERKIPLCRDLQRELSIYLTGDVTRRAEGHPLFCTASGRHLDSTYLSQCFRKLQQLGAVSRRDSTMHLPTLQDFRATFAVERLRSWIMEDADIDRLVPALSTYMGFSHLSGAGKYLCLVPERYTADLKKLCSNSKAGKRWRDHPKLMRNLAELGSSEGFREHSKIGPQSV